MQDDQYPEIAAGGGNNHLNRPSAAFGGIQGASMLNNNNFADEIQIEDEQESDKRKLSQQHSL